MPRPNRFYDRLTGRVAIVTGAGSQGPGVGTGKAIAYAFAREGASVCLVDRDAARAQETHDLIVADGGTAMIVGADVTDSVACAGIVRATLDRFGRLDVLVNNVGV